MYEKRFGFNFKMTTESPTGITAEFQNNLRSECERKLNETVRSAYLSKLYKLNQIQIHV
jgi:hypothetical protein